MNVTHYHHIVITGASSGIGKALALAYAAPGVHLALSGRDATRLASVAAACRQKGASTFAKTVDVCDAAEMHRWIEATDDQWPLDLVIANAGISSGTAGVENDQAIERAIQAVNIGGVANTVAPILPRMATRARGQLALISSLAGFRGLPSTPDYSASKAWVLAYGEALRRRWAPSGVGVSVVCPGFVQSRITDLNRFTMPGFMDAKRAAAIIQRGLARNRGVIAFPLRTAWPIRFIGALPAWITDPLFARLPYKE